MGGRESVVLDFIVWVVMPLGIAAMPVSWAIRRWLERQGPWGVVTYGRMSIRVIEIRSIAAIDGSALVRRLTAGQAMAAPEAEIAVADYRTFLAVAVASPGHMVAPPSPAAEAAWRAHLSDPRAYERDTRAIFGGTLWQMPGDAEAEPDPARPRRRTLHMLGGLPGLDRWAGLAEARAAHGIPDGRPIETATVLGLLLAAGPMTFLAQAQRYGLPDIARTSDRKLALRPVSDKDIGSWN